VEEATKKALEQLGVSRKEVEVTVVKEGKRGVLGLGAEDAVVKVKLVAAAPKKPEKPEKPKKAEAAPEEKAKKPEKPKKPEKKPKKAEKAEELEEKGDLAEAAAGVLEALIERLELEASVVSEVKPPMAGGEGAPPVITLNVKGDDLGILIGRRGQTLASLQHIVRLIIANRAKARVPIVIDVEGYKQRRYDALQALARRVAEQVKERGKPFALEPMPAYERRIIHLTLSDNPDVTTESTGDGEGRKVVIVPRKH
jgi:spoIIIJ-associated protein